MITDLDEYYSNIEYKSKDIAEYKDNEGNRFIVNPASLIVAVQYATLNKQQYEQAIFQGQIPKDLKLNEIEETRPIPKNEVTHKDEDKFILVDSKQKVKQVWYVVNNLHIQKAYNNKDEADRKYEEINNKIFEVCEVK